MRSKYSTLDLGGVVLYIWSKLLIIYEDIGQNREFMVICRVSTAILGVHTGLKMDQGYQILGNGH